MSATAIISEQRKHDRFVSRKQAIAALGRNHVKVGKIIDISLGGLAFEYIVGESRETSASEVDVFMTGNAFQLYNVPCVIVSDIEVQAPHVDNEYRQTLATRRCGLAFRNLNANDFTQLKLCLQAYSAGLA